MTGNILMERALVESKDQVIGLAPDNCTKFERRLIAIAIGLTLLTLLFPAP